MTQGQWNLKLKPDTPQSVRSALGEWGLVIITPTRINPELANDTVFDAGTLARYSGVVMRIARNELSGSGLIRFLGDESGKGRLTSAAGETRTMQSWLTVRIFNPGIGISSGTISATPTATMTLKAQNQTCKSLLDTICEFFECEWRVLPHGYLDVGPYNELFVTSPAVVVTRRDFAGDVTYAEVKAAELNAERNAEEYANSVTFVAEGEGGTTTTSSSAFGAPDYYGPNGVGVFITRYVDNASIAAADAATAQASAVAKYVTGSVRTAVKLSSDIYDIGRTIEVGDTIYVFDMDEGLVDSAVQIPHQGRIIFPLAQRVLSYTWPVDANMGVWFRSAAASGVWTDLTPWFEPETGATTIEVGAAPKRVTDAAEGRVALRAIRERLAR